MGERAWSAIGKILKISAILACVLGGFLGYQAFQLNQRSAPSNIVLAAVAGTVLIFAVAIVLWNLKVPSASQIAISAAKRRFSTGKWVETGHVGPGGATLYTDEHRATAIGDLDSFVPVQVIEKSLGYTRVVVSSGEGGWMDTRTLVEDD